MERIEVLFPRLRGTAYRVTSSADDAYNCIAWAAADTTRWWGPGDPARTYWPSGVARSETLAAFRDAFATVGYLPHDLIDPEPGFEKVALFAGAEGTPTHAARQLNNGRWTSKLGVEVDIEHALEDLTGAVYGSVVQILRRPLEPSRRGPGG
jgi:hypothetical protein